MPRRLCRVNGVTRASYAKCPPSHEADTHNVLRYSIRARRLASVLMRGQTSWPALLHPGRAVLNQFRSLPNRRHSSRSPNTDHRYDEARHRRATTNHVPAKEISTPGPTIAGLRIPRVGFRKRIPMSMGEES